MRPGLVSVTFRRESPESIISLCVENRLEEIEWGGDIHVPHGDVERAAEVGILTRAAGLCVAAYGSYYRLGHSEEQGLSFASVLATARALGAPSIRVWAGQSSSPDSATRARIVADAFRCADLAAAEGISIGYEFHCGTLTETVDSACLLLDATEHSHIFTLWQPPVGLHHQACLDGLRCLLPRLLNIHAFHWWPDSTSRHPLSLGATEWASYLEAAQAADRAPSVLLEFVKNDNPGALASDAATLRKLVDSALRAHTARLASLG
jgi:sugar phosphate isomerase/epimerase